MESEKKTRQTRIDPRFRAAGWSVVPFTNPEPSSYSNAAVEEFETSNGPADYALCTQDQIVGVAEAKKVTLGPQGVLTQAERYSKAINQLLVKAFRGDLATSGMGTLGAKT